jgi:hypothetical protein
LIPLKAADSMEDVCTGRTSAEKKHLNLELLALVGG